MPVFNLCRICLTESSEVDRMQPLFDDKDEQCAELVQKIEECGGIVLKRNDDFPKMICDNCVDSLNTSYNFRTLCQASEHALLDAIVKSELKSEPHDGRDAGGSSSHSQNEIFFELHSEIVDGREVDLEEVTGDEHGDTVYTDEMALNEYITCSSDSEYLPSSEEERKPKVAKTKQAKLVASRKIPAKKRGRPRAEDASKSAKEKVRAVRPGRGRKKVQGPPQSIMCEICGNIYPKRSLLNMHMRRHQAEKPFECEICGKTFACPSEMSRHMRVHTGEKPYACRFCGRPFADRSSNIKHERIHTNTRPFSCKTCGKSFTYSNVLKNHMLTHTGEKPFPCVPCNKTFSRKHQLDQHCSTITHQQTIKNLQVAVKTKVEASKDESPPQSPEYKSEIEDDFQ